MGCPFCGFSVLVLPSNFSPHQKNLAYVSRGCIGESCFTEYREGRNCTGKPVSEFGTIRKSYSFIQITCFRVMCLCLNFLVIQPLLG